MTDGRRSNDSWSGVGAGWGIAATLLAGIALWGGAGLVADRLAGTGHVFLAIGMLVGAGGAIYLVWLKWGKEQGGDDGP
jgi:ATP synthase protein I